MQLKSRIELSPKILRHHRLRKGLSFKQAGECLRKRPTQSLQSLANMYERIERTGVTSPERAASIGKLLGVDLDVLNGDRSNDDMGFEWWVECSSYSQTAKLVQGTSRVRRSLELLTQEELDVHGLAMPEVQVWIRRTRSELRLTYKFPEHFGLSPVWWSCRPARRTDTGVSWIEFTQYEAETLQEMSRQIAYWTADVVHERRQQTPRLGAKLGYLMTGADLGGSEPRQVSAERFMTDAGLARSIARKLQELDVRRIYTDWSNSGITISPLEGTQCFGISRWWRLSEGREWHEAPWRTSAMRELLAKVEERLSKEIPGLQFFELDVSTKSFRLRQSN